MFPDGAVAASTFLKPIFSPRLKAKYWMLILLWAAAALFFWQWWLQPAHIAGWVRFALVTALIAWISLLQVYFLCFVVRARRSCAPAPRPQDLRVAMIVTKTPSEPFALLRKTLEAMLSQDFPHDTWLADEDPTPETINWCRENGVRISSRKGRQDYHQPVWPRRTRCKEGNLAFFYDSWGYALYDIVSQLDADHVPQPGYLREMLRPFADPGVGYVSAPSICSSNAGTNWAARTRLDTEAAFHGVLQAGYSNGFAPMCIGSHYAVRTTALQQVGGLGPELAEDHSTTLLLNAAGWRGVHALDAIAIGDGPATVADMITQEFQWSRSLVTLLLEHTPRYLPQLPLRLKAQFLFCQLLYPLFALTFAAMYLLPIAAVVFDISYAHVTFAAYLGHALPSLIVILWIAFSIRADGLFRPYDAKVVGWEKLLFVLLQWPWVFWGCVMAVSDRVTGRFVDFRVTPKGDAAWGRLPRKIIAVYSALAIGCLGPVLFVHDLTEAEGFYLLTLINAVLYSATVCVIVGRHLIEAGATLRLRVADIAVQTVAVAGLVALTGYAVVLRSPQSAYAFTLGLEDLQIAQVQYVVAGAGSGPVGQVRYAFNIAWKWELL
jgi:cellulose synthase (UDP-forming)